MKKNLFELQHLNSLIFIFLFLLLLNLIFCEGCKGVVDLSDKANCYNDVITFSHKHWRAGHAATNKKGEVIVEFSPDEEDSKSRLFYGLKKNGRYFFPEEPFYKQIDTMTCEDCTDQYRGRFESRVLFVSLKDDTDKSKQYFFSMSSYHSLVELIDMDSFTYHAWDTLNFFGLSRPIFSYEYALFEIYETNTYIAAFIESGGFRPTLVDENQNIYQDKEFSNTTTIKKFQLDSFDASNPRTIIGQETLTNTSNGRVVSAFRLDDSNLTALLFVNNKGDKKGDYEIYFYNNDLTKIDSIVIYGGVEELWPGFGLFVKGINVKGDYAAFAFYHSGKTEKKSLVFKFVKYNANTNDKFDYLYEKKFDGEYDNYRKDVSSNGLYKLNDNRVVLFSAKDYSIDENNFEYGSLHMHLFDFYDDYEGIKVRQFYFYYPGKRFCKEMAAYTYNGYELFTATLGDANEGNIFSIMMIFGFGNGTDFETDISPFLMDTGYYDSSNNLYEFLIDNMTIDNNIFGYEKVNKIRLVKICEELLLYRGKKGVDKEDSVLPLNELFDANHTLLQNKDKKKEENTLYTLEYQFMVHEPDYTKFYEMPIYTFSYRVSDKADSYDATGYYEPKTFDGRTNILKFKLCHRYCVECMEFGSNDNDNDQKCINCKEEYTYDYLTYVDRFTNNCVPFGYMYDAENNELKKCETNYKYYYNLTRDGKRYCFKEDYDCPDVYRFLNTTSKECLDYTVTTTSEIEPTTSPGETPTTSEKESPTTSPEETPTTTEKESPTTSPEETPTTSEKENPSTSPEETPTTNEKENPSTSPVETPTTNEKENPSTSPEETPTTNEKESPSTSPEETPTTSEKENPSTNPEETPTTSEKENPSTNPEETPTTSEKENPSTILEPTPTTSKIIKPIPTTIIQEKCKYGISINYTSSYANLSNEDIYHITKEDIISSYCRIGSVLITGSHGYNFQVTNTKNELKSIGLDHSAIDLNECENILKEAYNIDKDMSLILIKFMKKENQREDQTFQYEIIHPITGETLNKSLCENTTIDVYVPFILEEKNEAIYNNILNQGYDPLDLNDKFYRELCTPYTSENGTDVLLDDREEFIYSSLVNASLCPDGCGYSEYFSDKKYIKCECGTNNTEIVTLDIEHISGNNAYKSFVSTMKSTNYKVMICYNLVFNFKIFCHNYGSIITVALFGLYLIFMLYYCIKEISPIKLNISRILFEEQNKEKINEPKPNYVRRNSKRKTKTKIKEKAPKENYPPKKGKVRKSKQLINNLVTENIEFIPEKKKPTHRTKPKIKPGELNKPSAQNLINNEIKSDETKIIKSKRTDIVINKGKKTESGNTLNNNNNKQLDDFELNNLEYVEACELDHRSFCRTYWSVLMREHVALLTFFAWKDYNLFYIKIEKFFILFCTDMTMNGLFFVHESMHKKYTNGEDFTLIQKLPQLLFTLIVSHIIEVLLCFLSMTDTHVYEIKALPNDKSSGEKIMNILDLIKRKLVAFFIVTFLFFLFYWYFISAFCAVYQNTQKIFLRDSLISFLTALIDPFIIYGFTTILRAISLCGCCRKKPGCGCVYKLSDIIPIF